MTTVFLDLDGTLIDPKEGITRSIQYALEELGADIPSQDELTWCIGPPLWGSFEVLLGPGADTNEAVELYRERFTTEGLYEAELYDGVGEMLEGFHDLGAELWIATSKPHAYANTIIDHFGISSHVNGLFGSELDGTNAEKPELLAHALATTKADPARSFMLGDRRFDIEGARANGLIGIGAVWGYGEGDELHLAEADSLASQPEDVPEIVADILGLET
ncbi:MAG: HAD hydrolase-like protein [Pseudomonadota bacterium]